MALGTPGALGAPPVTVRPGARVDPVKDGLVLSRSVMMAAFARHESRRLATIDRVRGFPAPVLYVL